MGGSGAETPTKASKSSSSAQEQTPAAAAPGAAVYPGSEWGCFQPYGHGFFPSAVASGTQAPPYMWGSQHMIPGYATHPYVVYPPGGLYAHPTLHPGPHAFTHYPMPLPNGNAEALGDVSGGEDEEGKSSDGKEISPQKGGLGSLNMITGKGNDEVAKTSGASNGAVSQSGESGSEDTSEGSDANSQKELRAKAGSSRDPIEAEVTHNGTGASGSQNGDTRTATQAMLNHGLPIAPVQVTGAPAGVSGPTMNLNIGVDYWLPPTPNPVAPLRGKIPTPPVVTGIVSSGIGGGRENLPSDLWIQDERELKRQRRKQSNRESARRSRLRKQAECEELGRRVDALDEENAALKTELDRIRKDHDQLLLEHNSLKESLGVSTDSEARLDLSDLNTVDPQNLNSEPQEGATDNIQGS